MNRKFLYMTLGGLLMTVGALVAIYGWTEYSIICPVGGVTPSGAAQCLKYENYNLAIVYSGLLCLIIGIFAVAISATFGQDKKGVDPKKRDLIHVSFTIAIISFRKFIR